jgi:hypothetical protein
MRRSLPQPDGPVDPKTVTGTITAQNHDQASDRRSVLADSLNKTRRSVTWKASLDRADANNAKVRKRHLELVVARAIRARDRELAAKKARE